ncbi:MAG TPA: extensin family protein [Kofleriaceae bacterium]|nr:extensin family protein [Kofleriaceae bacterium]
MFRLLLILSAFLVAGVATVDAAPAATTQPQQAKKKLKKKKKQKDDRRVTRSTRMNMPRGFTWPPSKKMVAEAEQCEAQLDELGVSYTQGKAVGRVVDPMKPDGDIGGITYTAVYSKDQTFDCQLVLALATFAPRLYELGVREVKYGSAFRWSKVRVGGKTKNMLSRHGLGIALDIVSFVDADGREANVKHDYKAGDELLLSIERAVNDSGQFRLLLTPKNDPISHSDHFHLEANPDYTEDVQERPQS